MTTADRPARRGAHPIVAKLRRTGKNLAGSFALLGRPPRGAGKRSILPATGPLCLGIAVAIVAVAAAMIFLDAWAIERTRLLPLSVVAAFNEITDFGTSGWFLWPIGLILLAVAALATPALGRFTNAVLIAIMVRLEFLFLAIALPGLTFTIVKRLIGRVRPSDLGPFQYHPFSWRSDYASLPSGHSTTAFSAAIAIGALCPRARLPLWIYAVTIALSRVVITAHFPSDVIAGAVVGGLGALLVRNFFALRRLAFTVRPDGRIGPWPGPSLQRIKRVARRIAAH
jgi:undecaprenyl-diphosphatase